MKYLAVLLAVIFIFTGILIIFDADNFFDGIIAVADSRPIYISAIIARLFLGIIFIFAANQSRYPIVIKVLGYISIFAAIIFIIIGLNGFQDLIAYFIIDVDSYGILAGISSLAFGAFLVHAFSIKSSFETT